MVSAVAGAIAIRAGTFARVVLRAKALGARPKLRQCAVNRDAIARQPPLRCNSTAASDSPPNARSRPLVKLVAIRTTTSMLSPASQPRIRSYSICSTSYRSEDPVKCLQRQIEHQLFREFDSCPIGEYSSLHSRETDLSAALINGDYVPSGSVPGSLEAFRARWFKSLGIYF